MERPVSQVFISQRIGGNLKEKARPESLAFRVAKLSNFG
jgi:hypothetical protein